MMGAMATHDSLHTHHSFIIRCWRDDANALHGSLIDALTQQTYPFVTLKELAEKIGQLVPDVPVETDLGGSGNLQAGIE